MRDEEDNRGDSLPYVDRISNPRYGIGLPCFYSSNGDLNFNFLAKLEDVLIFTIGLATNKSIGGLGKVPKVDLHLIELNKIRHNLLDVAKEVKIRLN